MGESKDRRGKQDKVADDRRKEQRRKDNKVAPGTPVRRDVDWDKIDDELKNK